MTAIGIDKISFYVPQTYLDLSLIAERDGIDPEKFHKGIGQERFAVPPHDEDAVTLAANAAAAILEPEDIDAIDTVLLATESGIDQSKAAAVYVHHLLGLKPNCRAVELKQACYSATAALQLAAGYIARKPDSKVLLIASDISRYDLNTPAEATQGSAACAMLISANPRIAALEGPAGLHTEDVMDFWRPNHRHTPLVDGKLSTQIYLKASEAAYADYREQGGANFADFAQYCYHLPFSKMGQKAHQRLCAAAGIAPDAAKLDAGMQYNRQIGNSYTASLYISLCSALDCRDDLAGQLIGMLSYGSGCVAEYFALRVADNYHNHREKQRHQDLLNNRTALTLEDYQRYWQRPEHQPADHIVMENKSQGTFRLAEIQRHERRYVRQ